MMIKCDRYKKCGTKVSHPELLTTVDGRQVCAPCASFIRELKKNVQLQKQE